MYKTIRDKVKESFQRATGMDCQCGKRITKRNIKYYRDEFGELKPICKNCAETIKKLLDVI